MDIYNDKGFDSDEDGNGTGLYHYEIADGQQGPEQDAPMEVTPAKQSKRKKKDKKEKKKDKQADLMKLHPADGGDGVDGVFASPSVIEIPAGNNNA